MRYKGGTPPLMIYTLTRDDIPLLSQWIKNRQVETCRFLVGGSRLELLRGPLKIIVVSLGHGVALVILLDFSQRLAPHLSTLNK